MSLKDIAEGVRGSKALITLGPADHEELVALVNKKGIEIEVDYITSNGACIVKAEDLNKLMFGDEEEEEAPQVSTVVRTTLSPATPPPAKSSKKLKKVESAES